MDLVPSLGERTYRFTTAVSPKGPIPEFVGGVGNKVRLIFSDVPVGIHSFEATSTLNAADWTFFETITPNENGFIILEDEMALDSRFYRPTKAE